VYTFVLGHPFYLRKGSYALFARGILRLARENQTGLVTGQNLSEIDTAFAAGYSVGVDTNLSAKLSEPVRQVDYIVTRFEDFQAGDRTQGALRLSTGLVIR